MKVKDLIEKLELTSLTGEVGLDREVDGGYTGDLLSWVMSHGAKGNVWITVQIHSNIVAVAVLLEFSCIIIPENIAVEQMTIDKAISEGIPVLQSSYDAFELCSKIKNC